jgi:NTE family protein
MENSVKKIAIACQGGGTHAAFEVGVLTEILKDMQERKRFDLVGLSGTSAGALCAMMVGYGLAPKKGRQGSGSVAEAIERINTFWDGFSANTAAEIMHNAFYATLLSAQEYEVPLLRIGMPTVGINPHGVLDEAVLWQLRQMGAREEYYEFDAMLKGACPEFDDILWPEVQTRVLLGASEIVNGVETVFDSACSPAKGDAGGMNIDPTVVHRWRARQPLSLAGVAASGTLPSVREAQEIDGGYYWDGLYSQNPPIREFLAGVPRERVPDEIWVVRINPQQRLNMEPPQSTAEIRDRENELMGNLSLNKELDFILVVNDMIARYGGNLAEEYKPVTVRTIKMTEQTATRLRVSSKFDRSRSFIDELREEGKTVAEEWLKIWPSDDASFRYPEDAAYH